MIDNQRRTLRSALVLYQDFGISSLSDSGIGVGNLPSGCPEAKPGIYAVRGAVWQDRIESCIEKVAFLAVPVIFSPIETSLIRTG